jgi:hypothetical protein
MQSSKLDRLNYIQRFLNYIIWLKNVLVDAFYVAALLCREDEVLLPQVIVVEGWRTSELGYNVALPLHYFPPGPSLAFSLSPKRHSSSAHPWGWGASTSPSRLVGFSDVQLQLRVLVAPRSSHVCRLGGRMRNSGSTRNVMSGRLSHMWSQLKHQHAAL